MSDGRPQRWFADAVIDGLMSLHVLGLDGRPAADQIDYTAQVWIESLWPTKDWIEALDAERIRVAFHALVRDCDRWPAPAQLRQRLPARLPQRRLPRPPRDERAGRAWIAEIQQTLRDHGGGQP